MSRALPPAAAMPSAMPCASLPPEGRLSRPTATRGGLPSRSVANVVYACPTARAAAGVSSLSTRPRMSYWRKIVVGSFMSFSHPDGCARQSMSLRTALAEPTLRGGIGSRRTAGGDAVPRRSREIEQSVGPDPEQQQPKHDGSDGGTSPPGDADIHVPPSQPSSLGRCCSGSGQLGRAHV